MMNVMKKYRVEFKDDNMEFWDAVDEVFEAESREEAIEFAKDFQYDSFMKIGNISSNEQEKAYKSIYGEETWWKAEEIE